MNLEYKYLSVISFLEPLPCAFIILSKLQAFTWGFLMANLEFHTEIHASLEKVYEISQDYAQRYEWDPFPEKIEFLNGAT